jgi:CHAT domain-containing protein
MTGTPTATKSLTSLRTATITVMLIDRLNADLVTLSGCRTGQGQIRSGEGVLSLARAFMEAGAHNVVMSLWKTDDEASLEFMSLLPEPGKGRLTRASAS